MPRAGSTSTRTAIACVVLSTVGCLAYALEPVAATYLDEALTVIERNFYRSSDVNWEALRATAIAQAQGARRPEDTYAAIVGTLVDLDPHALFIGGPAASGAVAPAMGIGVGLYRLGGRYYVSSVDPGSGAQEAGLVVGDAILEVDGQPFHPARVLGVPTSVTQLVVTIQRSGLNEPIMLEVPRRPFSASANASPSGELLDGNVGYLALPAHNGDGSLAEGGDYASVVQDLLAELERAGACGWVVDLRTNRGGNFGPMLAGIGPLVGSGSLGGFDLSGSLDVWRYQPASGTSLVGNYVVHRSPVSRALRNPDAPVAVLTGPATNSAAEIVVLALRGRDETRSFGDPTGGLTTWTDGFRLSDGAVVVVSRGAMADRTGERFDGPIDPDVLVAPGDAGEDAALAAALAWVREREACAN